MTDSQQRKTTSSGLTGNTTRYRSDSPPPAAHISFDPEMVGKRFGWVEVISSERRWAEGWKAPRMLVRCTGCHAEFWAHIHSLQQGKSKGCQACSRPRKIPRWLDRRLTAAKSRCTNPRDPGFENYGGRGIEFRFSGPTEAGLWMIEYLGMPDRSMELDRIDTNKHYEPGNLRWATHAENCRNRRCVRMKAGWDPGAWPYSRNVVIRMQRAGLSRSEILEKARSAVQERRKNWQGIAARLASLTS